MTRGASWIGNFTIIDLHHPVRHFDNLGIMGREDKGCLIASIDLFHELENNGAHLRVLEPEVSTKGPVGKMVLTVVGMVAEMEVGFIRERQRAGIEAAKARGVYKGRPVTLDHAKIIDLHKKGNGATAIAKAIGCSRGAVYKVLGLNGQ